MQRLTMENKRQLCLSIYSYFLFVVILFVPVTQTQTVGDATWQVFVNKPSSFQPTGFDNHGSSGALVNNYLVVYGGQSYTYVPPYAWVYDLNTLTWLNNTAFIAQLPVYGGSGMPNSAVTAVNGKVWTYGGRVPLGGPTLPLNSALIFDPVTWLWSTLPLNNAPASISQIEGHSLVYDSVSKTIYMFGGFDGSVHRSDLWKLSTTTLLWTTVSPALVALPSSNYEDWYDVYTRTWYIFGDATPAHNQFFALFLANETVRYLPNAGSTPLEFGYLFPKLPYTTNGQGIASSIAKEGYDNPPGYFPDYYPFWDAVAGTWSNISTTTLNHQFAYGRTVVRSIPGNNYEVYFFDVQTASVWRLVPNNNTQAFITTINSADLPVLVQFETNDPIISLTPKNSASAPIANTTSSFGFQELAEVDANGTVVRSLVLDDRNLQLAAFFQVSGIENYIFETINNTIALRFSVLLNDTTFTAASIPYLVSQSAVKLAITISNWPFSSPSNSLRLRMPYESPFAGSQVTRDNTSQPNLVIFTVNYPLPRNYSIVIRCLTFAEIDGVKTSLKNIDLIDLNNGTGFVELLFPPFHSNFTYDPDFSVVLQANSNSQSSSSSNDDTTLIIALSVGLGAGIPALALLVLAAVLATTAGVAFYVRHKAKPATGNVYF